MHEKGYQKTRLTNQKDSIIIIVERKDK